MLVAGARGGVQRTHAAARHGASLTAAGRSNSRLQKRHAQARRGPQVTPLLAVIVMDTAPMM